MSITQNGIAKDTPQSSSLREVIVGRTRSMSIHILDILRIQSCHPKGFHHGQVSSFTILRRGRLVEGITSNAPSIDPGMRRGSSTKSILPRLQHQESSSLAEIESGT